MNSYLSWLILSVITGLVCCFIARKKGRDAFLWFLAGAIFSVFALVIIIQVRNLKSQKGG
jgi:hypothetical protein